MDKEAVVSVHEHTHTHPGIQLSHKRNTILPFAKTWMDMEGIMLNSKVKQKSHSGNFKILLTDDENMTHKSLWDIARFKISENCIAINVDIRRREAKK